MCVIIICEKEHVKEETLKNAEMMNGHGGGIAYIDGEKVKYEKGIKSERIMEIIKSGIPFPYVIHFRIATVGGVNEKLTHPFPIMDGVPLGTKGTANALLFHNGHWSDWQEVCLKTCVMQGVRFPQGEWSDSRAMAWLANIYGVGFLNLIEGQNKIAVLTSKGIKRFGDDWKKVKGVMCSNDHFEHTYTFNGRGEGYDGFYSGIGYDEDEWEWVNDGWVKKNSKSDTITDEDILQEGSKKDWESVYDDIVPIGMLAQCDKKTLELRDKTNMMPTLPKKEDNDQ